MRRNFIRSNSPAFHRRLNFERLDKRLVLSATSLPTHSEFNADFEVDVVGERTSYRHLNVTGLDGSPVEISRQFLAEHAAALAMPANANVFLELVDTKYGLASSHVHFQQVTDGVPIHGAQVIVSLGAANEVQTVHSSFQSFHEQVAPSTGLLDAISAVEIAEQKAGVTSSWHEGVTESVYIVTPTGNLEPAWQTTIHADLPVLKELLVVVSAVDGRVILQEDRSAHATGSGNVYEPNPWQIQGDGLDLADNDDATNPTLDALLQTVTLERLEEGTGLLRGEWADVTLPGGLNLPVADEPTREYHYDRDDPRFEQVMVYYTIDRLQSYIHDLGYDDDTGPTANGIRDFPTLANAHWFTIDNSFYSTADDALHFGDGGVDDAEDADIIVHEYGHAILNDQNPNWGGGEMGAMGEGFSDYLAASFYADIGDTAFQQSHAAAIGEWDAVSYSSASPPNLRRVDGSKRYPDDLEGTFHADGEIWSAALWDLRTALDGETVDRLVLESHFGLPARSTMADGAEAILAADLNLNGGTNQAQILQAFVARGILVQPDDHGNESDEATLITVPSQTAGDVDYEEDPDFFQFTAVVDTTYQFHVELGTSLDTTLTLLAGDDELATNDNGGDGSLLVWTAPADLDFFLLVSGSSPGSYTLDVFTIPTPADDHGDLPGTSTTVAIPDEISSDLEVVGDVDVFSFEAIGGDGYLLEARLDTLEQSVLRIIDTDGLTELAIDDDGEQSFLYWSPDTTGTYYAEVSGVSQGTYDFAISSAIDDHGDDPFNATFVNAPSATEGRIELFGDIDFFEFPTVAGTGYEIQVLLDTLTDSTLRLFDVDGFTELEFDDDGGAGFSSLIEWIAPLTATYFLAVEGFDGTHNGIYDLRISTFTPANDDHGNDATTATTVELDSVTPGELEQLADSDWFAFAIPEGIGVTLEASVIPAPDTTLTVYDSDGVTQLAFDDDGGDGVGSRIEFSPIAAGTYFAAVRGFANNETGTYEFSVTRDVDGDFDNDDDYDCDDIDALVAEIAAETNGLVFDLNGDQIVDHADLNLWLVEAGAANLGPGRVYLRGDANLSGGVDVSDFNLWNAHKFQTDTGWCRADFNASGATDVSDLNIWNSNKFSFSAAPAIGNDELSTRDRERVNHVVDLVFGAQPT